MLKYSDLTKGQKRCIDAFIARRPELATADTMTTKEVYNLWNEIYAQRGQGGTKVGYPNWLPKYNQVQRGLVYFPGPNSTGEKSALEKSKLQKIINDSESTVSDDEFEAELRANGIQV